MDSDGTNVHKNKEGAMIYNTSRGNQYFFGKDNGRGWLVFCRVMGQEHFRLLYRAELLEPVQNGRSIKVRKLSDGTEHETTPVCGVMG